MGIEFCCYVLGFVMAQVVIPQAPVEPSPWWIIERFGKNLVTATTIDGENQRLVLTIDSGVWANLDYLERYSILHHLSQSAIPYGYALVLQTPRQRTVATLTKNNWELEPTLPLRANPVPLR